MTTEVDETKINGIRPAHNTDDIPIKQDTQADLQATGYMMAYYVTTPEWKEVLCDVNGKLVIA